MNLSIRIFILTLVVLCVSSCSRNDLQTSASPQEITVKKETIDDKALKQGCINAAICGINSEIERYQNWIDQREEDSELNEIENRLSKLKADLERFKNIELENYKIPPKLQVKAWVRSIPSKNSILYVENMTRSGPWYHICGIKGRDYTVLKPNEKYLMTIYLVYPRHYWHMKSYYIYIDEYKGSGE